MSKQQLFILCGIVTVAVVAAVLLRPSDEKKILKNLGLMSEYCTTESQEPGLTTLQKTSSAAKLCTDPCKVQVESFGVDREFSRKEIANHIMMMKKRLVGTTFTFQDINFSFVDNNRAELTTTLRLNGKTVDGRFTDAYELQITAVKVEGDWLFSSFSVVEFMEK